MIFTECPHCDYPQAFIFGTPKGRWMSSKCRKCSEVMWVEMIRVGGLTITTEGLLEIAPPEDREKILKIVARTTDHSTIVEGES